MSYADSIARDARMIVLRELARQTDGRLNAPALRRLLDDFGVKRSHEWLETQLNKLVELEAIRLHRLGEILVAEILPDGRDHVEQRAVMAGVSAPHELGG